MQLIFSRTTFIRSTILILHAPIIMKSIASLASFVALATVVSADRTFTVNNKCSYTVWCVLLFDTQPLGR